MNIKPQIQKNLINISGRSTRRKIVVIESDDWGSIRMHEFENIRSIRPGYGLHPKHYKEVPGKRAKVDMERGTAPDQKSFS